MDVLPIISEYAKLRTDVVAKRDEIDALQRKLDGLIDSSREKKNTLQAHVDTGKLLVTKLAAVRARLETAQAIACKAGRESDVQKATQAAAEIRKLEERVNRALGGIFDE